MGGPARMMSPNADWAPVLPIRQNAATLWYHANTPNRTAQQVYNGLAGMWLVEDEVSKSLPIPNHYGVDDFPVIIQDKRLDNFGTPEYNEPGSGVWQVSHWLGDGLVILAMIIWGLLTSAFITRLIRFPHSVLAEVRHPVLCTPPSANHPPNQ